MDEVIEPIEVEGRVEGSVVEGEGVEGCFDLDETSRSSDCRTGERKV